MTARGIRCERDDEHAGVTAEGASGPRRHRALEGGLVARLHVRDGERAEQRRDERAPRGRVRAGGDREADQERCVAEPVEHGVEEASSGDARTEARATSPSTPSRIEQSWTNTPAATRTSAFMRPSASRPAAPRVSRNVSTEIAFGEIRRADEQEREGAGERTVELPRDDAVRRLGCGAADHGALGAAQVGGG